MHAENMLDEYTVEGLRQLRCWPNFFQLVDNPKCRSTKAYVVVYVENVMK